MHLRTQASNSFYRLKPYNQKHKNKENSQFAGNTSPDSVVNTTPPRTNRQLVEDKYTHSKPAQVPTDPDIRSAKVLSTEDIKEKASML